MPPSGPAVWVRPRQARPCRLICPCAAGTARVTSRLTCGFLDATLQPAILYQSPQENEKRAETYSAKHHASTLGGRMEAAAVIGASLAAVLLLAAPSSGSAKEPPKPSG